MGLCPCTLISVLRSGWFNSCCMSLHDISPLMPDNFSHVPVSVRACGRHLRVFKCLHVCGETQIAIQGTGTPKDRDEVNRREVCECDGWVCDFEVIGVPSRLRVTRKTTVLTRMLFSRWVCKSKIHTNSPCNLPDVLGIVGIKEMTFGGLLWVCLLWIDETKVNIKPTYECRCNERLIVVIVSVIFLIVSSTSSFSDVRTTSKTFMSDVEVQHRITGPVSFTR